ncbi:RNA-directed RNA polymerase L, partial [Clarias magur]
MSLMRAGGSETELKVTAGAGTASCNEQLDLTNEPYLRKSLSYRPDTPEDSDLDAVVRHMEDVLEDESV